MTEEQPEQPISAEQAVRQALDAADPAFMANELQLALFRSDLIAISDQMRARLSGFMHSMVRACSVLIDGVDDGGTSSAATRQGLPDEESLIASAFVDAPSLLLLYCRAWEAELVRHAAASAGYTPEAPPGWTDNARAILTNRQAAFLKNAGMMHLESGELSAMQWRRIVLRLTHKISAYREGREADLRESARHLLTTHDESQARLAQAAMFVDRQSHQPFDHGAWQNYGPTLFLLALADNIAIPFDALILASAMREPLIFGLALLAGRATAQDVLLIMGETPMASTWFASAGKASHFAKVLADQDSDMAKKHMARWMQDESEAAPMLFDRWPWGVPQ
ncbi:MAG: hypothetical protein AAFX04_05830 [Pseudomonadota bacterium]